MLKPRVLLVTLWSRQVMTKETVHSWGLKIICLFICFICFKSWTENKCKVEKSLLFDDAWIMHPQTTFLKVCWVFTKSWAVMVCTLFISGSINSWHVELLIMFRSLHWHLSVSDCALHVGENKVSYLITNL